ncbi:MAG TPA: glycosyltransferase family 2 protein, partial [Solirubrobacteraceae bacterium]|nr:glycosyltransferase family 2 protein [Solirubrobacteraceae bacterium]
MSYALVDIELNEALPDVELGPGQHGVAVLVRRNGRTIGWLLHESEPRGSIEAGQLSRLIAEQLRFELMYAALLDELDPPAQSRSLNVTVCVLANGKPDALQETLDSVTRLGPAEMLVGDPREAGGSLTATRRHLLETAAHDHVAFVEAGTVLDRQWAEGLGRALARPGVGLVSGPLLPRGLESAAQVAFERRGGERHSFHVRQWFGDPLAGAPLDPAELRVPWGLNNVVVNRSLLLGLGGLGTPAAMAYRVLRSGASAIYEPGMLAFHDPPQGRAELRRRHAAWGQSLAAAAGAAYSGAPESRRDVLSLAVRWMAFQASEMVRPVGGTGDADLIAAQLIGALAALPTALRRAAPVPALGAPHPREDPFGPARILHIDLASQQPLGWPAQEPMLIVAWWRDIPLGHLFLPASQAGDPTLRSSRLAEAIAPAVGERLFGRGFERVAPNRFRPPPPPPPALERMLSVTAPLRQLPDVPESEPDGERPSASVIVCTQRRPEDLRRCLASLTALVTRPLEIIVVDNDPDAPSASGVVDSFPGVVYIHQPHPGLSVARNTGVRAARGAVVAFVDDDVTVHRLWLAALLRGFSTPQVLAVTGLVLPAELETRAQVIFELSMGQARRGHRRIAFDRSFFAPQLSTGPPVWTIGAGANMAFRREALDRVGLFDERLGAGAAGCSEDSELWYR